MQQAVTSTQFSLPSSTTASLLAMNRNLLLQSVANLFKTLNEYLAEANVLNKLENENLIRLRNKLTSQIESLTKSTNLKLNDDVPVESIVNKLIKGLKESKETNRLFVVDPLLEPLLSLENKVNNAETTTFFQNRYGFSQKELIECKFNDPLTAVYHNNKKKSNLLSSNKYYNALNLNQQQRGFKTKRNIEQEDEQPNLYSIFKKSLLNESSSPLSSKTKLNQSDDLFKSILQKKNLKDNKLGSIFSNTNSANAKSGLSDDAVAKIAFTEGFLYKEAQDKKKVNPFVRLFVTSLFILCLMALISPISFIGTSSVNGKNGSNGINIRTLTGNVNYEVNPENVNVKFDDVKGLPEAKQELSEIVDFLRDPEKYSKLGARLPKGVLLVGPPGCGKTLLAKSVAGEAGVPFFQASGSDFDEMFVGTGSKRVRNLFAAARAKAPCVVFIDEIDSVGSTRTNSMIHPHANQTINQLLAEMDGFQKNEGVIVLGATNRRETLDSALMRPGRFDVEVRIDKPDLKARVEMLNYYLDKVARDKNIDVHYLARQCTGLGGSSLENIVNQAALRAVVNNSLSVKMEHLEWALDRTLMGYGKSRISDEECNRNTAYHEAGHVLVAYYTKDSDNLHKVTILPRAMSLGHTAFVPENDVLSKTKSQLLAQMDVSMGGRVAEELAFGQDKITTGASGDFRTATNLATQMVKTLGMSDKIGTRVFESSKDGDTLSPQTQELLDQEIKRLLQESYDRAKNILKTHSYELKLIAEALLVHETLDVDQIKTLIENHKL